MTLAQPIAAGGCVSRLTTHADERGRPLEASEAVTAAPLISPADSALVRALAAGNAERAAMGVRL